MTEQRHQRAAAAKDSDSWRRKVDKYLFKYHRTRLQPNGRWDPYKNFTNSTGKIARRMCHSRHELTSWRLDILKFFSGHEYRRFYLIDRELYARFAIRKILESHPNDSFETTGVKRP
jgi:hypothetical protein